jgi:4-methylaminobutanoate oxidase (formaldehyde-forming)
VGELGWELYVPSDQARHAYSVLLEAGAHRGLVPAGMHALDSCRIEKKFLHFGHDIADEDTPVEAGMRFVCHFDKSIHFIGRDAVSAQLDAGGPLKKRLVQFLLQDGQAMLYHHEPILRDGAIVGHLTSGNYGHTLGGSVGLGYVRSEEGVSRDFLDSGDWQIDVAGVPIPAKASLRALYDPKGERSKA